MRTELQIALPVPTFPGLGVPLHLSTTLCMPSWAMPSAVERVWLDDAGEELPGSATPLRAYVAKDGKSVKVSIPRKEARARFEQGRRYDCQVRCRWSCERIGFTPQPPSAPAQGRTNDALTLWFEAPKTTVSDKDEETGTSRPESGHADDRGPLTFSFACPHVHRTPPTFAVKDLIKSMATTALNQDRNELNLGVKDLPPELDFTAVTVVINDRPVPVSFTLFRQMPLLTLTFPLPPHERLWAFGGNRCDITATLSNDETMTCSLTPYAIPAGVGVSYPAGKFWFRPGSEPGAHQTCIRLGGATLDKEAPGLFLLDTVESAGDEDLWPLRQKRLGKGADAVEWQTPFGGNVLELRQPQTAEHVSKRGHFALKCHGTMTFADGQKRTMVFSLNSHLGPQALRLGPASVAGVVRSQAADPQPGRLGRQAVLTQFDLPISAGNATISGWEASIKVEGGKTDQKVTDSFALHAGGLSLKPGHQLILRGARTDLRFAVNTRFDGMDPRLMPGQAITDITFVLPPPDLAEQAPLLDRPCWPFAQWGATHTEPLVGQRLDRVKEVVVLIQDTKGPHDPCASKDQQRVPCRIVETAPGRLVVSWTAPAATRPDAAPAWAFYVLDGIVQDWFPLRIVRNPPGIRCAFDDGILVTSFQTGLEPTAP